jgi:aquaporin Z
MSHSVSFLNDVLNKFVIDLYLYCLDVHSNVISQLNKTSSPAPELSVPLFYQFWRRYLRKAWHYIVVPPIIATAKRLQREEVSREEKNNNNGNNDPNENEEDFHIDYTRATQEFFQRLFTEFIGTMILTTIIGANLLESRLGLITNAAAAFNNGLVFVFLIYPLGGISGAHFNPVVTLTFTMRRVFPLTWLVFYALSQFVGSIVGGLLIRGLFSGQYASLGTNSIDTSTSTVANGFKWEIFLTFCLVFVILQTATKSAVIGSQAAIAVGGVLAVDSLIGGPESTASMNPWRTLGPSIINNSPDDRHSLWIFIVGPLVGSLLAYLVVSLVKGFGTTENEITSAHGEALNNEPDDADRGSPKRLVF